MAAYLLLRDMKTLHLRVRQQNESALRIARYLHNHPAVTQVERLHTAQQQIGRHRIQRRAGDLAEMIDAPDQVDPAADDAAERIRVITAPRLAARCAYRRRGKKARTASNPPLT